MQKPKFLDHEMCVALRAGMRCLGGTWLLSLAVVLTVGLPPTAFAEPGSVVDPALVGVWEQRVPNPLGVARWEISIGGDGAFTFRSEGPGAALSYVGTFTTSGGRWTLSAPAVNWSDEGAYQLPTPDTFVMHGKLGTGIWRKIAQQHSPSPSPAPRATGDATAHHNRGLDLYKKGQYDEAIVEFTKAIKINPQYALAYSNRGTTYHVKGDYDQSIADCTKALEIDPTLVGANLNRGASYLAKGKYDEAIADSTKATKLRPELAAVAYKNRGNAYYEKGEYAKALEDLNKAQALGAKVDTQRLEELRKATQASEQPSRKVTPEDSQEMARLVDRLSTWPPRTSTAPEDSQEIARLVDRINQNYKDALEFQWPEEWGTFHDDGYLRKGQSVTLGQDFTLEARYLECPIPGSFFRENDDRIPTDYRMSVNSVEDCDKQRHGLEWGERTLRRSLAELEPSSIADSGSTILLYGDPVVGGFVVGSINCKDRIACEQMAADLKTLVTIARKSPVAKTTPSPEPQPKTAQEPRQTQSDSAQATPRLQWKFKTGGSVGSPSVSQGMVYVISGDHLYAIDGKGGQQKWKVKTSALNSPPAVADGALYFCSGDELRAVDSKTGRELWKVDVNEVVLTGSPAVADGVVYFGTGDYSTKSVEVEGEKYGVESKGYGRLHAVDSATGQRRSGVRIEDGFSLNTSPAIANGVIYLGSWDGHLYAFETTLDRKARSRPTIWKFKTGGPVSSSPAVADGVVYVASDDHYLYAVDIETHQEKWKFNTAGVVRSLPAVADGVVYVNSVDFKPEAGLDDSHLYAVDAKTGQEKWRFKTGGIVSSSPAVDAGVVYVGSKDSRLYAVDAKTGREKWRFKTGGAVFSSPAVADGVVYVGSEDGYLYAINR